MKHYIMRVWSEVPAPELLGPYKTSMERDNAAVRMSKGATHDRLLWVDSTGTVSVGVSNFELLKKHPIDPITFNLISDSSKPSKTKRRRLKNARTSIRTR